MEEQRWLVNHTKNERYYIAGKMVETYENVPKHLNWEDTDEIELIGNCGTHRFICYTKPSEMSEIDWRLWKRSGTAQGVCVFVAKKFGTNPTSLYQEYLSEYVHTKYRVKV